MCSDLRLFFASWWPAEDVQKALWALQGDYIKAGELQVTQKMPGGPHFCAWAKKRGAVKTASALRIR